MSLGLYWDMRENLKRASVRDCTTIYSFFLMEGKFGKMSLWLG